jgi:hypothetical protein
LSPVPLTLALALLPNCHELNNSAPSGPLCHDALSHYRSTVTEPNDHGLKLLKPLAKINPLSCLISGILSQ